MLCRHHLVVISLNGLSLPSHSVATLRIRRLVYHGTYGLQYVAQHLIHRDARVAGLFSDRCSGDRCILVAIAAADTAAQFDPPGWAAERITVQAELRPNQS